jgi:hypothetical protein
MSNGVAVPSWVNGPVPGVSDPGNGGCVQLGPLPPISGRTATLVILRSTGSCHDATRKNTGIVFFDFEPVVWNCLSDDEVSRFEAWGAATLSPMRILVVGSPVPSINCPPTSATALEQSRTRDAIRGELRSLAPTWFASGSVVEAPRPAA